MDLLGDLIQNFGFYSNILTWLIIILFYISPGKLSRLYLTVVVVGFVAITTYFDFFLARYLLLAWLIFSGMDLMVGKWVGLTILVLIAIVGPASFLYYLLAIVLYIIIFVGFIQSGSKKLQQMSLMEP